MEMRTGQYMYWEGDWKCIEGSHYKLHGPKKLEMKRCWKLKEY